MKTQLNKKLHIPSIAILILLLALMPVLSGCTDGKGNEAGGAKGSTVEKNGETQAAAEGQEREESRGFLLLQSQGSAALEFAGEDSDPGVTVSASYSGQSHRFIVKLKSCRENIKEYYEKAGIDVSEVTIDCYRIGLRTDEKMSKSYITAAENGGPWETEEWLMDAYDGILDYGYTEEDIKTMFGTAKGVGSSWFDRTNCYIETSVTPGGAVDFDQCSLPAVFQLDKPRPYKKSIDTYEFYGAVRYKVTGRIPHRGITTFFVWTEEAAGSAAIET